MSVVTDVSTTVLSILIIGQILQYFGCVSPFLLVPQQCLPDESENMIDNWDEAWESISCSPPKGLSLGMANGKDGARKAPNKQAQQQQKRQNNQTNKVEMIKEFPAVSLKGLSLGKDGVG